MKAASAGQLLAFFTRVGGRATRTEYALGLIFLQLLVAAVFVFVFNRTVGELPLDSPEQFDAAFVEAINVTLARTTFVWLPATIGMFIIAARRCHDIGLPGIFVLLFLVPVFVFFWMIALAIIPGTAGANRYGPQPRYHT